MCKWSGEESETIPGYYPRILAGDPTAATIFTLLCQAAVQSSFLKSDSHQIVHNSDV